STVWLDVSRLFFLRCQPAAWWETVIGGASTKRKTPQRYDPTGASNFCKNQAYAFASVVFSSVFGVAFAAMARALRPFLLRAFPNDPRARLPFSVLLSPRPIGRSFHIHCD
ncbi:MAG: hypothetical protein ACO20W_10100, partial [Anaerohalosphaeraceae bacterium]